MPSPKQVFEKYYRDLLASAYDHDLAVGLSRSIAAYRERRARALQRFPHTVEFAREVRQLQEYSIDHLGELVEEASSNLRENGAQVHYADSADAKGVADQRRHRRVKSPVSEAEDHPEHVQHRYVL